LGGAGGRMEAADKSAIVVVGAAGRVISIGFGKISWALIAKGPIQALCMILMPRRVGF